MELTEGSETTANHNLTPGKYPKEHIQYSKHGKSLKSRIKSFIREDADKSLARPEVNKLQRPNSGFIQHTPHEAQYILNPLL
jgi:hypothetical protein